MASPIKRSKALMPLSREHHYDLLLAWKIRMGIGKGISPERIAAYILYMDENLLKAHFEDEEKWLFLPLLPEDGMCERAVQEHEDIRELIRQVCVERNTHNDLFIRLADAIDTHVRFEERELFPHLERTISKERLAELGKMIHAKHGDFMESWEDVFWEKK